MVWTKRSFILKQTCSWKLQELKTRANNFQDRFTEFHNLFVTFMKTCAITKTFNSFYNFEVLLSKFYNKQHVLWQQQDSNLQTLSSWTKNTQTFSLSCCGFESRCCHLNFRYRAYIEQEVPWHSGNYSVDLL